MSVEQLDSDQMIPLTPMSSFGHLDIAGVVMPVPTGQPVITNQVPTETATKLVQTLLTLWLMVLTRMHCGHQTHHEWVWF